MPSRMLFLRSECNINFFPKKIKRLRSVPIQNCQICNKSFVRDIRSFATTTNCIPKEVDDARRELGMSLEFFESLRQDFMINQNAEQASQSGPNQISKTQQKKTSENFQHQGLGSQKKNQDIQQLTNLQIAELKEMLFDKSDSKSVNSSKSESETVVEAAKVAKGSEPEQGNSDTNTDDIHIKDKKKDETVQISKSNDDADTITNPYSNKKTTEAFVSHLAHQHFSILKKLKTDRLPASLDSPYHQNFISLSRQMENYADRYAPTEQHLIEKDQFLSRLQQILGRAIASEIGGSNDSQSVLVCPFGSAVNGFWTPHSDLDICLKVPGVATRAGQIRILRKVGQELGRVSSHYIEPRFGAKVPIIHWSPRIPGMLSCDISVNNVLAIANSRLVGQYVSIDRRVHTLGVIIKAWASNRGINDRSRGTLSSFSLILMLISYLQDLSILPSLQDLAIAKNQTPLFITGVDCRYATDEDDIKEELEFLQNRNKQHLQKRYGITTNVSNHEELNVGWLFYDFLRYYGLEYKSGQILVRNVSNFNNSNNINFGGGGGPLHSNYLHVDNPFEIGKDVANVEIGMVSKIRDEFRRAVQMVVHGISLNGGNSDSNSNSDSISSESETKNSNHIINNLLEDVLAEHNVNNGPGNYTNNSGQGLGLVGREMTRTSGSMWSSKNQIENSC